MIWKVKDINKEHSGDSGVGAFLLHLIYMSHLWHALSPLQSSRKCHIHNEKL